MVLEEKLQSLRTDKALMKAVESVHWTPLLSEALESLERHLLDRPDAILPRMKPLAQTEDI